MTFTNLLAFLEPLLAVVAVVVGYFSLRGGLARNAREVEDRLRNALRDENELLTSQIRKTKQEIDRVNSILLLIVDLLKKTHNIDIDIDGNIVSIRDAQSSRIVRVDPSENT